jgi:uncharacterized protein (TIGR03435 family)
MKLHWVLLFAASLSLQPQAPDAMANLQFEVASLKPTVDMNVPGIIKRMPGDRGYVGTNMPLMSYIRVAYQVRDSQVAKGDALLTENFDLDAKAERASTPDELHVMLQHLLEERFHLKMRREIKEEQGYVLVVDKGGPKMDVHAPEDYNRMPLPIVDGVHNGINVTMPYLAFFLSTELDRTVIDKTGLDGGYDFKVEWYTERGPGAAVTANPTDAVPMEFRQAPRPTGPTVFVALQKTLGLRLDAAKVPTEKLVIEHIEKLTEN